MLVDTWNLGASIFNEPTVDSNCRKRFGQSLCDLLSMIVAAVSALEAPDMVFLQMVGDTFLPAANMSVCGRNAYVQCSFEMQT